MSGVEALVAISAVSAVVGSSQAQSSARAATAEGNMAAEMEKVAAKQRETDRKVELAKAIGAIRARGAGAGIDPNTGSPLSVINREVAREQEDTRRDRFNTRVAATSARYRGLAQSGQLRGRSYMSLLQGAESIAGAYSAPKKKGSIK